jgi:hypothetical protein
VADIDGGTPSARKDTVRLRRGTAQQWADANPALEPGEEVVELDTGVRRRGNADRALYLSLPDSSTLSAARVSAGLALVLGG